MREECFGAMKPVSDEDYNTIYQTTGLDIDGRKETATQVLYPLLDWATRMLIKFTRYLPGFSLLQADDQIALVKGRNIILQVLLSLLHDWVTLWYVVCDIYRIYVSYVVQHVQGAGKWHNG